MKPRFNQRSSLESLGAVTSDAPSADRATLPHRDLGAAKPARVMRSAWLKLQLFVADVRHHNKLRML